MNGNGDSSDDSDDSEGPYDPDDPDDPEGLDPTSGSADYDPSTATRAPGPTPPLPDPKPLPPPDQIARQQLTGAVSGLQKYDTDPATNLPAALVVKARNLAAMNRGSPADHWTMQRDAQLALADTFAGNSGTKNDAALAAKLRSAVSADSALVGRLRDWQRSRDATPPDLLGMSAAAKDLSTLADGLVGALDTSGGKIPDQVIDRYSIELAESLKGIVSELAAEATTTLSGRRVAGSSPGEPVRNRLKSITRDGALRATVDGKTTWAGVSEWVERQLPDGAVSDPGQGQPKVTLDVEGLTDRLKGLDGALKARDAAFRTNRLTDPLRQNVITGYNGALAKLGPQIEALRARIQALDNGTKDKGLPRDVAAQALDVLYGTAKSMRDELAGDQMLNDPSFGSQARATLSRYDQYTGPTSLEQEAAGVTKLYDSWTSARDDALKALRKQKVDTKGVGKIKLGVGPALTAWQNARDKAAKSGSAADRQALHDLTISTLDVLNRYRLAVQKAFPDRRSAQGLVEAVDVISTALSQQIENSWPRGLFPN